MPADPVDLRVATFNIRNTNDRYAERKALLGHAFAAIDADIIGLQEVVFAAEQQADFLAANLATSNYFAFDARSGRDPEFGNAILCRVGEVQAHEELRLAEGRVAHRILVILPGNRTLWVANTHLHHRPADENIRLHQARAIAAWMRDAPRADGAIVQGDFNAQPTEPAYRAMIESGFESAFRTANGTEPPATWPSGIQAETADIRGEPGCVDYIWVNGSIEVRSATLAGDTAAPADPTLYPSDHFAVVAEISLL